MGTLCQSGKVTSGKSQPEKQKQKKNIYIANAATYQYLKHCKKEKNKVYWHKRRRRRRVRLGLHMITDSLICLCHTRHFIGPHFSGLNKRPGLQPIIAATLSPGTPTSSCSWPSCWLCWRRNAGWAQPGALWCHRSLPAKRRQHTSINVSQSRDSWWRTICSDHSNDVDHMKEWRCYNWSATH